MRRSLDTSAHVTSAFEVDMSKVVAIREKLKKEYEERLRRQADVPRLRRPRDGRHAPGLAVGERRDPRRPDRHASYVNLGFAVALEDGKGLIVPVVKNAEGLNLLGMAQGDRRHGRARARQEAPAGRRPGRHLHDHEPRRLRRPSTARRSSASRRPAILGTYAVVKRPWVVQDELGEDVIAIRPIMNLTLTYDHRLVDGALRRPLPARPAQNASRPGTSRTTSPAATTLWT